MIRRMFALLVVPAVAGLTPRLAEAQGLEYVKAHYTKHEFKIPMRDGVRLFTSVYVPKDDAKAAMANLTGGDEAAERIINRIGQLTRTLRESMRELGLDTQVEKAAVAIPDARDRLDVNFAEHYCLDLKLKLRGFRLGRSTLIAHVDFPGARPAVLRRLTRHRHLVAQHV